LLPFTIGSSTQPTSTQADALITRLYAQAYDARGETYAAYSAAAEHAVIDTPAGKDVICREAERLLNAWAGAGAVNPVNGSTTPMPVLALSAEARTFFALTSIGIVSSSTMDDWPELVHDNGL
jgi:hypothetical protein